MCNPTDGPSRAEAARNSQLENAAAIGLALGNQHADAIERAQESDKLGGWIAIVQAIVQTADELTTIEREAGDVNIWSDDFDWYLSIDQIAALLAAKLTLHPTRPALDAEQVRRGLVAQTVPGTR